MRRSPQRLWIALSIALALCSAGLVGDPSASAAIPRFNAFGTVRCTMSGTHINRPGMTFTATAGIVQSFKAKLACTTGTTGNSAVNVKSGRITATSVPATLSCASPLSPPVNATIKWVAQGGKVNPTHIIWAGATNVTSPRVGKTYPASAASVTGSYAQGTARAFIINDVLGQAACNSTAGLKRFQFTGAGGASTFEIPNSPGSAIQLFRDDFNGTSLDRSRWRPNWLGQTDTAITKSVNTAEQSCYDPAQASVAGGSLHLKAVARSCTATNGVTYPFASGLVETRDHFTFTYGHLEARLWLPPGSGAIQNWPAFWADGTGVYPTTGELDVFEGIAGRACWHFHSPSGGPGGCASAPNPAGWHTYAADWRPGVVTYFYDGVPVGQITQGITSSPMFLILNLGLSSTISGPVTVPSEMLVDYVLVTT